MGSLKIVFILLAVCILGAIIFFLVPKNNKPIFSPSQFSSSPSSDSKTSEVIWEFNGGKWQTNGNPPPCPDPLIVDSPVNLSLVSGILYPGQIRGDFKAHGGFRFDNRDTNNIEVHSVMDGYILKAARYNDGGEIQNFMFYVSDCGIMIMHDHLLTLSPGLQEIFDKLPVGQNGDSRTTSIEPKAYLKKGELLATEVGYRNFEGRKNIFLDFGLYDLRKPNGIKSDGEYAPFGLCWLDYLSMQDQHTVKSLPAGGREGKTSDYCN